jgi:hypothetical protein
MIYTYDETELLAALDRGEFEPELDQETTINAIKEMALNTTEKRKKFTSEYYIDFI